MAKRLPIVSERAALSETETFVSVDEPAGLIVADPPEGVTYEEVPLPPPAAMPRRDVARHESCGLLVHLPRSVVEALERTPGIVADLWCGHCLVKQPLRHFTWQDGSALP